MRYSCKFIFATVKFLLQILFRLHELFPQFRKRRKLIRNVHKQIFNCILHVQRIVPSVGHWASRMSLLFPPTHPKTEPTTITSYLYGKTARDRNVEQVIIVNSSPGGSHRSQTNRMNEQLNLIALAIFRQFDQGENYALVAGLHQSKPVQIYNNEFRQLFVWVLFFAIVS